MALMALDHTRDFFSTYSPPDLTHANFAFFATRWITHLCAPTFVFLAGMGARLSAQRAEQIPGLRRFLIQRGLLLIALEILIVSPAWRGSLAYVSVPLLAIWALGWSMIFLGLATTLPSKWIGTIGVSLIAFHNLLDPIQAENLGSLSWLWHVLHQAGNVWWGETRIYIGYPLVPWVGVMMAGYAFGGLWNGLGPHRARFVLRLGLGLLAAFMALRLVNIYGDPKPWVRFDDIPTTLQSFLDVQKYPPSLAYSLVTLGLMFCLLFAFKKWNPKFLEPLNVLGRVPLFFYVLHLHGIHLLAYVVACVASGSAASYDIINSPPPGWGFGFPAVYIAWMLVLLGLCPICQWYANLKARANSPWLRYF